MFFWLNELVSSSFLFIQGFLYFIILMEDKKIIQESCYLLLILSYL
jgi:hypothetical protein